MSSRLSIHEPVVLEQMARRALDAADHPAAIAALDALAAMVTETAEGEARLAQLYAAAGAVETAAAHAAAALELDDQLPEAWFAAGLVAEAHGLDARRAYHQAFVLGSAEGALNLAVLLLCEPEAGKMTLEVVAGLLDRAAQAPALREAVAHNRALVERCAAMLGFSSTTKSTEA